MWNRSVLFAVAACGSHALPPPPSNAVAIAQTPSSCPAADALDRYSHARLHLPTSSQVENHCAEGRFPAPGWFLFVRAWSDAPDASHQYIGIVSPTSGPDLVAMADEPLPHHMYEDNPREYTAADLDGDGIDEIIDVEHWTTKGGDNATVTVLRVAHGELVAISQHIPLSFDDRGIGNDKSSVCPGDWKIEQHRLVLTVASVRNDGGECPPELVEKPRRVFELVGDDLVERDR